MVLGIKKKVEQPQAQAVELDEIGDDESEDSTEELDEEEAREVIRKAQEQIARSKKAKLNPVEEEEDEDEGKSEELSELSEEQEALINHEKRIQSLEAMMFRLKQI